MRRDLPYQGMDVDERFGWDLSYLISDAQKLALLIEISQSLA